MADEKDIVRDVVEVLHDGQKGFAELGKHLQDSQVKTFFMNESLTRSKFAGELESAAGLESDPGGTASGAMHRFWGDLKGKMGGGDHTLLETAEQGEDVVKKAYQDAWLKLHPNDFAGARPFLAAFESHLDEACVGSISEIFDAEAPYTPRGCIAQAWSVAEVLRCLVKTAEHPAHAKAPQREAVAV